VTTAPNHRPLPPEALVERLFDAFTRRDVDGFLALSDPGIVVMLPTADVAREGRPYVGAEGVRAYFDDIAAIYEELRLIPQLIGTRDDITVVIGRVYARGTNGITDTAAGWVIGHTEGLIESLQVFTNRYDALEEGGIAEEDLQPL
jgi:ketosteroid isomerase-like protein